MNNSIDEKLKKIGSWFDDVPKHMGHITRR